jgi:hypothetical protein
MKRHRKKRTESKELKSLRFKKTLIIIVITLLSLSGEAVAVIHQIKLQTERFGAVMQFAYIWNLYDLFSLTLLGLAGNLPLLVKLDDLNEQIEREIFLKRGY